MGSRSLSLRLVGFVSLWLVFFMACGASLEAQTVTTDGNGLSAPPDGTPIQLAQYYYYPNYPYPQVRRKKRRPRRRAAPRCKPPWKYSAGLRRCICVQEGYSLSHGKCVETAKICQRNATWSDELNKCACDAGFSERAGECVDPSRGVVTYTPSGESQCLWPRIKSADDGSCVCSAGYNEQAGQCVLSKVAETDRRLPANPNELLTNDVTTVQECLKEAGYLRSLPRSTMSRAAWTAFWFFKQDYAVGKTPKGIHEPAAQHKLFTLCPQVNQKLAMRPASDDPASTPQSETAPGMIVRPAPLARGNDNIAAIPPQPSTPKEQPQKAKKKKVYARPEAGCLPDDLHRLIVGTYGARASLAKCATTCIARPVGISNRESAEFEEKRGIRWCKACIEIGTSLPLEDILRIERGANVQVCTRPPTRLPKWVTSIAAKRPAYTRIRELFNTLPRKDNHKESIAVVIGNSAYAKGVPANTSASSSANAFYALLIEHLGFEQENVIDLRNATSKDLQKVFGKPGDTEGELARHIAKNPEAQVFVYFAGHAMTRADGGESFLLPADTVKYREERSGYSLSQLYQNLQALGAKSVLVMLEADFGRDLSEYVFPPNLPEMQVSSLPKEPVQGINVLVAGDGDQRTLDDPKYGIGLFTRYLIEGLAGRADLTPIGNGDSRVDTVELYAYTSHMVRLSARKSFGLIQKPMMSRSGNLQVSGLRSQAR